MAATTLVQAKVDTELKSEVEKCFAEFGIDTSTAIRMFFKKVAQTRTIPFVVGTGREEEPSFEPTEEFGAFLLKAKKEIEEDRDILRFDSNEEAIAHLEKLMK
jgi:addiction module RelB/DinJ family antitoxin